MATAKIEGTKPVRKAPKPILVRIDDQLTRAVITKKVTAEELLRFETRITKLKGFLTE
jgi:hypothetical protein